LFTFVSFPFVYGKLLGAAAASAAAAN